MEKLSTPEPINEPKFRFEIKPPIDISSYHQQNQAQYELNSSKKLLIPFQWPPAKLIFFKTWPFSAPSPFSLSHSQRRKLERITKRLFFIQILVFNWFFLNFIFCHFYWKSGKKNLGGVIPKERRVELTTRGISSSLRVKILKGSNWKRHRII